MSLVRSYQFKASPEVNDKFLSHAWKCLNEGQLPLPISSFETLFALLSQMNWRNSKDVQTSPSNKKFIQSAQKIIKTEFKIESKVTQLYEIFSKVLGEKSWNVVQSKQLNFFEDFFPKHVLIPTGFLPFDKAIGGVSRGFLLNVHGSNNSGKTSLMVNLGSNMMQLKKYRGEKLNLKVLHMALENSAKEILFKYMNTLSEVSLNFSVIETEFNHQLKVFSNVGKPKMTFDKFKKTVLSLRKDFSFDVLVLDLVQNLEYPGVSRVSVLLVIKQLAELAKELDIVIINGVNHQDLRQSVLSRKFHQIDSAEMYQNHCATSLVIDKDNSLTGIQKLHLTQSMPGFSAKSTAEFEVNWANSLFRSTNKLE